MLLCINGIPLYKFALDRLVVGVDLPLPRLALIPLAAYWRLLLSASAWQQSSEAVARSRGRISADTVLLRLKQLGWQTMLAAFDVVSSEVLRLAKRRRLFTRPVMVAIDMHDFPYYGDHNHLQVVRGKSNTYFFRYASLDIVESGRRYTVAMIPVFKDTTSEEVLLTLIPKAQKHLRILCVLLDAGFFSVGDVNTLEALGVDYTIRPRMTGKLAGYAIECLQQKKRAFQYPLGAEGRLVPMGIADHEGEFRVYLTTVDPHTADLGMEYKNRWGIETGYRVHNDFQAKTTSNNYTIRLTLWLLAIFLYNIWILRNRYVPAAPPHPKNSRTHPKVKPTITTFQMRQHLIHHLDPP